MGRKRIDASKVFEAVESGQLSKEVIDSFGLRKSLPTPGRRRRGHGNDDKPVVTVTLGEITITKRGSLVLPRELVVRLGYSEDDTFVARKTKAGLLLKPV